MIILCILFVTHWLADFVFQNNDVATNKWNGFKTYHLNKHGMDYLLSTAAITIWLVLYKVINDDNWNPSFMWYGYILSITVLHVITDYFTSKMTHRLWEEKKVHNFFVVIGLDQLLHSIQIICLYYIFWN